MVKLLLEWREARSGLGRGPEAHKLADELITLVVDHVRRSPVESTVPGDAQAIPRVLAAIKDYLDVVDALIRALRESGVSVPDLVDPAEIRDELTRLLAIISPGDAAHSKQDKQDKRGVTGEGGVEGGVEVDGQRRQTPAAEQQRQPKRSRRNAQTASR